MQQNYQRIILLIIIEDVRIKKLSLGKAAVLNE